MIYMIYVNNEILNKILSLKFEDIYLVFDFDRTITRGNSETSWSMIENSSLIDKGYRLDSRKLYNYYRKIEVDNYISNGAKNMLMEEWTRKQLQLFSKYNINEELFKELILSNKLNFRNGLDTFFKEMYNLNIPIIIISAGLGNVIYESLKQNNCLYSNVHLISNMLKFDNNLIQIEGNLVNSTNKNNISIPNEIKEKIKKRKTIILFGDQISDLTVLNNFEFENKISIGFLSSDTNKYFEKYKQYFDLVCTECESYENINKILIKKKM